MTNQIIIPTTGDKITFVDGKLSVPNNPIIPFIEGDGIGVDVTPPMLKVVNAAVAKAYAGEREIAWLEVYAGEKATKMYDSETWLPEETLAILQEY